LLHVLPGGFHRIRHYGLLANGSHKASLALVRELLHTEPAQAATDEELNSDSPPFICRHCGHAMIVVQTFARSQAIRAPPCATDP
jgi:hypothetical protein